MFPADRIGFSTLRLGAAGLALGSAAGAWLEYTLLRRALARRIGRHGVRTRTVLDLALAAVLGGLVGVWVQLWLPSVHPIVIAFAALLPFGLVYVGVSTALGHGIPLRGRRG